MVRLRIPWRRFRLVVIFVVIFAAAVLFAGYRIGFHAVQDLGTRNDVGSPGSTGTISYGVDEQSSDDSTDLFDKDAKSRRRKTEQLMRRLIEQRRQEFLFTEGWQSDGPVPAWPEEADIDGG